MFQSLILKHSGDLPAAAALADEARCMDLADRYVNSECVKRMLQADQVEFCYIFPHIRPTKIIRCYNLQYFFGHALISTFYSRWYWQKRRQFCSQKTENSTITFTTCSACGLHILTSLQINLYFQIKKLLPRAIILLLF